MAARRGAGWRGSRIADWNAARSRKLHTCYVGEIEGLAVTILEDDYDLARIVFAPVGLGGHGGDSQNQYRTGCESNDKLAHLALLRK
jgi:hypothetical protein